MAIKVINTVLFLIALIGVIFAYRAASECRCLLREQRRLEAKVGSLVVNDTSKVHVRAMPTCEQMHFEWRVYVPAGVSIGWQTNTGICSGNFLGRDAVEFIARVRLRESEKGLDCFTKQYNGSSSARLGDRELADLLHGRWGQIQVEQLGSERTATIPPDEVVTILRLTLPDDLKREAKQVLDERLWKRIEKDLFTLQYGSDRAFQKAEEKGQPGDGA